MTRPLRFLLHVALVAGALVSVPWLLGAAVAATGDTVIPPPTPDAIAAYLTTCGPIVGGLTLAYVLAGYLLRTYRSSAWLAQGKRLAWATAGLGVAGTALQMFVSGTPIGGVVTTAVIGLIHIADAQVTPPVAPVVGAQKGFTRLSVMLALAGVGVALALCSGCAGSQRTDTIKAALITADSARDGFLAYDRAHEMELVQQAVSADDARAKLIAYQTKRAKVDPMFALAYRAIAAAELLNDDTSVTSMQSAIVSLLDALKPFLSGSK